MTPESQKRDAPENSTPGDVARHGFRKHIFVIGTAAFVTSIAQIEVIGQLPIRYLLMTHLGVKPEQMSLFFLVAGVAWYVKPAAGIISDSVPLFGTRRRHYLMLSAVFAALCWILMAMVPETYFLFLLSAIILNAMIVMSSTVMGGLLVEQAHAFHASGRLSSLREGMNLLAGSIGAPVGGYLAIAAFGWTAAIAAGMFLLLAVVVYLFLDEAAVAERKVGAWKTAWAQMGVLVRSRPLLMAGGLLFLFYITPGFATPLYYIQTNVLKFSQAFIGWQAVISGVAGMFGAMVYARACKVLTLRPLLITGIALSGSITLFYLWYHSVPTAIIISAVNGFFGTLGVLPLYDLATRATPEGSEGLGFAVMMSVRNLALFTADLIGSYLMQAQHWTFPKLVFISSATTFLVLLFIPFLPEILLNRSDAG